MIDALARCHPGVRLVVAIGAGVMTALGFAPYGWWPLLLIGVAGLTLVVRTSRRWRGAAALGFGYGVGLLLLGIGWMHVIFVEAMLGLVAVEALFYLLLAVALRIVSAGRWWPIASACCWTAVEALYSRFPFGGFGWMRLGFAMVDSPLAWGFPILGVVGVGFLTALAAQLLAWCALRPAPRRLAALAFALAGCVGVAALGLLVSPGTQLGTVNAGWVQGGAPGGGVFGLGPARTITHNQVAETDRLATRIEAGTEAKADFVVWPENSTDEDPFTDAETADLVRTALARAGVPILVGAVTDGPGADERQTASLWWDPTAGVLARYDKRGIVPFGEWIPLRSLLLPLVPALQYVGAQSVPGTQPGVMHVTLPDGRSLSLGVMVCYDVAFDSIAYDTARYGGQVMVVQSSNAMYQGTGQIEQQFAITRARAMELRREVLVTTTSGISGLIRADGSIAYQAPSGSAASSVVTLPVRQGTTPAVWLASWWELGLVLAALGWLGSALWCGRIDRSAKRTGEEHHG